MSVIISRSKKHLSLGRLMTQASTTTAYLSKVRQHLAMSLAALSNLEESFNTFSDHGKDIPKPIMASVKEEHEEINRVSRSVLMIMNVVDGELKKVAVNLDKFHKELEKAEKRHEKEMKKAAKPKKPALDDRIKAAAAEIMAAKKDELEKK